MKRNFLIFGGQGFIGINLALYFSKKYKIKLIGRVIKLKKNPLQNLKKISYLNTNIFKLSTIEKLNFKNSIVILPVLKNKNVKQIDNLISLIFKKKPFKIILLSSVSIYGSSKLKTKETSRIKLTSEYSKFCRIYEKNFLKLKKITNANINILRIGNVFGSYRHKPGFIEKLLINFVYYKKYIFDNKNITRSYLSINDLIKVIDKISIRKTNHIIYNVSNPNYIFSKIEILKKFQLNRLLKNYSEKKLKVIKLKTSILNSDRLIKEFKIKFINNFTKEIFVILNYLKKKNIKNL